MSWWGTILLVYILRLGYLRIRSENNYITKKIFVDHSVNTHGFLAKKRRPSVLAAVPRPWPRNAARDLDARRAVYSRPYCRFRRFRGSSYTDHSVIQIRRSFFFFRYCFFFCFVCFSIINGVLMGIFHQKAHPKLSSFHPVLYRTRITKFIKINLLLSTICIYKKKTSLNH